MVRIHAKHGQTSDQIQFLYDCASSSRIDEIALELTRISNLQAKIQALVLELEPLLLPFHGDANGILFSFFFFSFFFWTLEPLSLACFCSQAALPLVRALSEANSYASKDQVVYNKPLSYYALRDHVQCIAKELSTVSPLLGFSDLDQFRRILTGSEVLKEDTIQLLWAGKVLDRGKRLSDYIGENEKTKALFYNL
ncbi:hypothetical protein FEM48_Zijuj03G0079500 [Ziziphus jujuba var. spinosa]|uniref:Uncharacterized protein n=1 Tax=Ziziphus jujuba var. spinosa TaxID=714518 RepID=A0A978VP39_ZIZJJ|nr:hypothetical protein FEM48_Zijuj03G0079500 [Ziziphus jujuba var. spinosa]